MHFDDFVAADFAQFNAISTNDAPIWNLSDPLTAILSIDISGSAGSSNDGSVVTSQVESCCWIFSTLRAPWSGPPFLDDGYHPVSGNRQFGFIDNQNGMWTIYSKGVDRVQRTWIDFLLFPVEYIGGDQLWPVFATRSPTLLILTDKRSIMCNEHIV